MVALLAAALRAQGTFRVEVARWSDSCALWGCGFRGYAAARRLQEARGGFHAPSWCFFGVVAGLAESGAVAGTGGPALVPGNDVVVVADRGIAVRGPAGV